MFNALRQRAGDEGGFTLIELLVVILIIGILAAIAIPAFLSQTSKASDSAAKTQVGTLQTTMETCAAENNGSFEPCEEKKLKEIEPTLNDESTAKILKAVGTAKGYEVESEAVGSKDTFKLVDVEGAITRSCTPEGKGGCKAGGTW